MTPGRSDRDDTDDAPAQALDDVDEDDDLFDPQLLDPSRWRDDDDVPAPDDPVTLDGDPDDLSTDDDGDPTDDDVALPVNEPPIDDDLEDLDATDQVDPVILPWSPWVELVAAGTSRSVEALVQPGLARSVWEAPGTSSDASDADAVLRIEGLAVPVRLRRSVGDRERILLGRDVLAGRFLLRL
jgi:hypothetical protein